ncbi:MAG: bifunctional 23S rRNA (guanine(2069)-N(7))-methyltransferase RlmK/23S rRNA (guanine(2445)-N(2))-methyltransferase RlmL [Natronospirillum sp.]|uniref:bifunctional 23S rRNA (guanine(2069)-N(7))-methyltransferase RlmK/23S rRNA (guanine(2445)-N(2))-methyltransferase RlmL n=1 Tax=Natronospirillum sp. TaxID=2812955 RepID=UPI0025E17507|nr:bifunctional 23S rRNA (guanine(2069)-N(7))-methyltransferase RlmK/23S rRNA (guanine(2445)-N(2))-methyltransferase RlmL [Natronospirillum sp.]MCH8550641.1 bifunctional 23S rRNA (guanine(2069)-N(7))-methyltransferase RlmK/23S rRNA (guanine(2445)-N(2))-methyltransferase RlmL [Natronospirillum sp.]
MNSFDWFLACPRYIEPLLADELTVLGAEAVRVGHAGVQVSGDLAFAYRAILWSRLASRVTLQLTSGSLGTSTRTERRTPEQEMAALGALLAEVNWTDHMSASGTLRVRFSGRTDAFRNTLFGAQWVKDQIVDYFQRHQGARPSVSEDPDLTIVVNLHKGQATIGIELNSRSLHARDYRSPEASAPLRESLAAAVLWRAGWPRKLAEATTESPCACVDPMCGSGTILIEAALMAYDWAPGLVRKDSLNLAWPGHDLDLWEALFADARERQSKGVLEAPRFVFWGNDATEVVYSQAREAWRQLGLPDARWTQARIDQMPAFPEIDQGLITVNPPYGQRLSDPSEVEDLYRELGAWMRSAPDNWQGAVLLPDERDIRTTGLFFNKKHALLNGQLLCHLYRFDRLQAREVFRPVAVPDLTNRLRKNLRRLKSFVRQELTNAYRVYDADLPEYAVAIDRYGDWLHIQEYAPPATIEPAVAARRLEEAVATASETLAVPPERIAVKQRRQQKGRNQYSRLDESGHQMLVFEHGAKVEVNMLDYLDTGLFLDHRPARFWLQQQARGKRVLNLFCYTGVASVHAALGGAKCVDSVDLSPTYLAWAQRNFQHNAIEESRHGFYRADVMAWLADTNKRWDLIFLDPPTFSNSSRLDRDFDIQRDHEALLELAMSRLNPKGVLLFSNNFRRFRLAPQLSERYRITDWHRESLPTDFQRNPRIHQCWLIRHVT